MVAMRTASPASSGVLDRPPLRPESVKRAYAHKPPNTMIR